MTSGVPTTRPSSNPGAATGQRITPFFDDPPDICKVIAPHAIESANMSLRKITQNWGSFHR